ncbi:UNVERIFIED_CONTAM: protein ENHANCED DISEASE RESISTANCE 2 [Sesamum latifolium]|uniref:Protein ENHANCED DISEASE RESISTANCE 2 n=1 Tax=Sesamum latifolium TaxID=2727402 RepID=A0AAW2TBV5_9LAMI
MGMAESEGKMEGWLYLIRFDRFGLQFSRKRYFVLEDNCLRSFKSIPTSETEEPLRSAIIDSCIRVVDNGRGNHHKRLFFVFTLYNTSNHNDTLKDYVSSKKRKTKIQMGRATKRRDFLLRRYWRREDDGTYGGGYVITPIKQGRECVIKHMLAVDWKFWRSYLRKASARSITVQMLGRVAALSEMFRAKAGNSSHDFLSGDLPIDIAIPESEKEEIKTEVSLNRIQKKASNETPRQRSGASSLDKYQPKLSSAATLVKKLQGLAVQKKGYVDLQGISWEQSVSSCYGSTLPKDTAFNTPITAKGTLMQMVAADWLRSDKREDDLAGRPGSIVQVPGATTYNLALYYMLKTPLQETPLLERFVNGDDAFRNSRFKLIPYISKGSWIVKQSVGRTACLVGQALEINYFRGTNYLEGNTPEELPEFLLGTCRLNHLDAAKAVSTDSVRIR